MREMLIENRSGKPMGRFSVEFEVANHKDETFAEAGALPASQVRRAKLTGIVDTGATGLVLPGSVAAALGFPEKESVIVRYADDRTAVRTIVKDVEVQLLGRSSTFEALVEPDATEALIGAIVFEVLDLVVDCSAHKLAPRDPRWRTAFVG